MFNIKAFNFIKLLFIFIFLFITFKVFYAQDPHFSQFYATPIYLNPALTGATKCPRVILNYRNQWPALGSTYVTYMISYDQEVSFLQGSLGGYIYLDSEGDGAIKTFNFSIAYSYTFIIDRFSSISIALQPSFMQKKLNWDFIFPDMIHPLFGVIYPTQETNVPTKETRNYFDISSGILYSRESLFAGFAVHHITQPTQSFRNNDDAILPRKFTLHAGYNIPLSGLGVKKGELILSPNILFHQQQNFQQLNWGLYLNRKGLVVGLWFRQNFKFHYDAIILVLGYLQERYKLAYSYDITVSGLKNHTLGSHEISLTFNLPCKEKKKKFRTISCPSF